MEDVYKVETPGPDGHIIEFYVNKTGYFEWVDTTRFYITPKHFWRDVTNMSALNPTSGQIIGTGPYMWSKYVPGESIRLQRHGDWRWDAQNLGNHVENHRTSKIESEYNSISENTPGFTFFILMAILLSILLRKRFKIIIQT